MVSNFQINVPVPPRTTARRGDRVQTRSGAATVRDIRDLGRSQVMLCDHGSGITQAYQVEDIESINGIAIVNGTPQIEEPSLLDALIPCQADEALDFYSGDRVRVISGEWKNHEGVIGNPAQSSWGDKLKMSMVVFDGAYVAHPIYYGNLKLIFPAGDRPSPVLPTLEQVEILISRLTQSDREKLHENLSKTLSRTQLRTGKSKRRQSASETKGSGWIKHRDYDTKKKGRQQYIYFCYLKEDGSVAYDRLMLWYEEAFMEALLLVRRRKAAINLKYLTRFRQDPLLTLQELEKSKVLTPEQVQELGTAIEVHLAAQKRKEEAEALTYSPA